MLPWFLTLILWRRLLSWGSVLLLLVFQQLMNIILVVCVHVTLADAKQIYFFFSMDTEGLIDNKISPVQRNKYYVANIVRMEIHIIHPCLAAHMQTSALN